MWYYPLKRKSHVHDIFIRFKAFVDNYFNLKIKILYIDNGREYHALTSFLATNGNIHFTSPPYIKHNGFSKRHHRHIVETWLSLLSHVSLPLIYWTHTFATIIYLINRMPIPTLNMSSPFTKIFGTIPNYSKLHVFGCLCYPWLRPYTSHKLKPRYQPYVFFGYSNSESAYLYFDPHTSHHVKFIENIFPYTSIQNHLHRPEPNSISS